MDANRERYQRESAGEAARHQGHAAADFLKRFVLWYYRRLYVLHSSGAPFYVCPAATSRASRS
jgi:hypothetical protein